MEDCIQDFVSFWVEDTKNRIKNCLYAFSLCFYELDNHFEGRFKPPRYDLGFRLFFVTMDLARPLIDCSYCCNHDHCSLLVSSIA